MTPNDLPPSFQKSSLDGKVAVVTGSTQGLGEATARLFRERGCKGLVLDERGKKLAEELTTDSCQAVFVRANLEDLDEVRNIFRVADMTFGTAHILVNAAATTDRGSLWDTTPEDYDRIMNVNTRAPFFLMQDAARIMEREKVAGSIINISSTASYGSMPMIAAYGMSKGALNVATKNAAYSLMWSKIRVNALAIGWMDTPGEDAIQRKDHCDSSDENWKAVAKANQPFGRLLKPEEVARCIAFCASEESGMMTGCVIDFDQSVWGAGNAPVPPPKEQWAKANGMTFSFEQSSKTILETPMPQEPAPKSKKKEIEKKESKRSAKKAAKEESKGSGKTTPRSTPRSSPRVTHKRATTPKRDGTPKRASQKDSPKTNHYLSANRAKFGRRKSPGPSRSRANSTDSTDEMEDQAPMIPDFVAIKAVDDTEELNSHKEETTKEKRKEVTPHVSPEDIPKPKISKMANPADAPFPEELRPDPEEFKRMLKLQDDDMQLDDYLPGTDPFRASQKQAEAAKQRYGGNSSDSSSEGKNYLPSSLSPKTTRKDFLQSKPPKSPNAPQRKLQDTGEVSRPDVYFSENNPDGKKKERNNKKVPLTSVSDHGDYRAARVQDWLGGDPGKAQRRSYKVKKVREVSAERTAGK
eukprot:CAMPEP_0116107256 /NCGR_PEP_ID=MMETSP0327-20121206/16125_1 /TAXON_ID=44447 /ORGANISM="Pseudo-nitzschia delicatissima, Strain B596" /LENGTH=638 /DNA_ID=CAMNT_0003600029 /DNA_START=6 /DNA_END=1923 /DNA_ORIENTATION=+